jgi:predicted dehydrogenase
MVLPGDGRRRFLRKMAATSASALLASRRGLALSQLDPEEPVGAPLGFGVVGCGQRGREILEVLLRTPWATVTGICDTDPGSLKKGAKIAPDALALADHGALLDADGVEAIVVATPTHLHRKVVEDALRAGRHVYCEAPLASSVGDAKAIATAGLEASTVFQGGLQGRSNALWRYCGSFVKSGVLGSNVRVTAHWAKKDSWRRIPPTAGREEETNWRLRAATSSGLPGEVGLHLIDLASTYLDALPGAVTAFGSILQWRDGRDIADTVHCVLGYPGGVCVTFAGTLASSVGGAFTLVQGTSSSLMIRETRGWLIQEADAPLLGWEVYARKEPVLGETGLAMIADSTRILAAGQEPAEVGGEPARTPLHLALEDFYRSVREGRPVVCGPLEAYRATVVALEAHLASLSGERRIIEPESLELG